MDFYLPDTRLCSRAEQMYEAIVATGSMVLRRIGGNRAGEIAAHRFLDNERVRYEAIIDALSLRTFDACKGRRIVAVQDTTEINFSGCDASRHGLGIAASDKSVGFFIHPLIAVDMDCHAVLGLASAEIWTRGSGQTPARKHRPFAEKDSSRWLRGLHHAKERLSHADQVIVVGDRESDIYSVFAGIPEGIDVVVRASHNRLLKKKKRLFDISGELEEQGNLDIDIAARPGQKARTARIVLRSGRVKLPKPLDNVELDEPCSIELNFVEVLEINPPQGCKPINWRLLTTLPVSSKAEVEHLIDVYRMRWRIEEVFRALKTNGLDLEATQVEAADRLFKLAALGIAAATRIVQLVDARDSSLRPAEDVIDSELIEPIHKIGKTLEGKTDRQKNHHLKGSLSWLSWIVARLGGWNCYYKPPGPKTMAIGWRQLATMLNGFVIATRVQNV